jgi:hypothetical protein
VPAELTPSAASYAQKSAYRGKFGLLHKLEAHFEQIFSAVCVTLEIAEWRLILKLLNA